MLFTRRRRGGPSQSVVSSGPYLPPLLQSIADKAMVQDANEFIAKRRERKYRGSKPVLTDEQILEARALNQFAGWGLQALTERYEVSEANMRRILDGITRAFLVAKPSHLPKGVEPL